MTVQDPRPPGVSGMGYVGALNARVRMELQGLDIFVDKVRNFRCDICSLAHVRGVDITGRFLR